MNFTSHIGENLSKQESVAIWNNLSRDMRAAHGLHYVTPSSARSRTERSGG